MGKKIIVENQYFAIKICSKMCMLFVTQVVECIRDLFQVVFALKNREQHIEQHHLKICSGSTSSLMSSTTAPSVTYMEAMAQHLKVFHVK